MEVMTVMTVNETHRHPFQICVNSVSANPVGPVEISLFCGDLALFLRTLCSVTPACAGVTKKCVMEVMTVMKPTVILHQNSVICENSISSTP